MKLHLREGETMDTVARILFQPGDWPLPADSRTDERIPNS